MEVLVLHLVFLLREALSNRILQAIVGPVTVGVASLTEFLLCLIAVICVTRLQASELVLIDALEFDFLYFRHRRHLLLRRLPVERAGAGSRCYALSLLFVRSLDLTLLGGFFLLLRIVLKVAFKQTFDAASFLHQRVLINVRIAEMLGQFLVVLLMQVLLRKVHDEWYELFCLHFFTHGRVLIYN